MSSAITAEAAAAICAHMNDDHADAIVAYAHYYAGATDVTDASMTSIDATAMTLTTNGRTPNLRIPFDHELQDTNDARVTLIGMAQTATPKSEQRQPHRATLTKKQK